MIWLLEELSIPYFLKLYQRSPKFSPPELKSLHPMGASPVLEDLSDPTNPLLLAESDAVAEYIIHKHGNGRLALGPQHPNYSDYLYWFHFANGSLQPLFMRLLAVTQLAEAGHPMLDAVNARLQIALRHFDKRVSENTWLAGEEFTAADIMNVFSFTTMRMFVTVRLDEYPGILAWLGRCTERGAYKIAKENGDPEQLVEELISAEGPKKFGAMLK